MIRPGLGGLEGAAMVVTWMSEALPVSHTFTVVL